MGAHLVYPSFYEFAKKKLPTASGLLNLAKYHSLTLPKKAGSKNQWRLANHKHLLVSSNSTRWNVHTFGLIPCPKNAKRCYIKGPLTNQNEEIHHTLDDLQSRDRAGGPLKWKVKLKSLSHVYNTHVGSLPSIKRQIPQLFQAKKQERDNDTKAQTLHGGNFLTNNSKPMLNILSFWYDWKERLF